MQIESLIHNEDSPWSAIEVEDWKNGTRYYWSLVVTELVYVQIESSLQGKSRLVSLSQNENSPRFGN